jgi:hypothetical protein
MAGSKVSGAGLRISGFSSPCHRHHHTDEENCGEDEQNQPDDLPHAPWPFAGDLAGSAVHQNVKQLVLVAVMGDPDRQEQVLEGDRQVLRLLGGNPLVVAADVAVDEPDNLGFHEVLGFTETFLKADAVAFRLEAREKVHVERLEFFEVPRREIGDEVGRYALGATDEHVVEAVLHAAGNGGPARSRDGARLRHGVSLGVGLGIAFGVLIIVAAFAAITGVGHGIVSPVWDIDAVELAEIGGLFEFTRSKPEPGDPFFERLTGLTKVAPERHQRFRRDHARRRFRLVLQVRAAEWTLFGDDLVFEQHHGPATAASHLRCVSRDG